MAKTLGRSRSHAGKGGEEGWARQRTQHGQKPRGRIELDAFEKLKTQSRMIGAKRSKRADGPGRGWENAQGPVSAKSRQW